MAKRKANRRKTKPDIRPPTGDEIVELARLGLIKLVTCDGEDDAVIVVVPDELQVPKVVDADTQSAEDRVLIEDHSFPDRIERLLRAESLAMWKGFARFELFQLLQSATGMNVKQLAAATEKHKAEPLAISFLEQVICRGFGMAIERYADQLKDVPELQRRKAKDAQNSRKANDSKRRAPVSVGTQLISRDERDERMAAEYTALVKLMRPTPACQQLAERYGFESWQGVKKAIAKFYQRGRK